MHTCSERQSISVQLLSETLPEPALLRGEERARSARHSRRRDVAMSVGQRMHGVLQEMTFVVHTRQADFRQFARGHTVVLRTKGSELARRSRPVLQNVEVLFVADVAFSRKFTERRWLLENIDCRRVSRASTFSNANRRIPSAERRPSPT